MELYVHIPFCVRKCDYCDFLSAPATEAARKQYVEALKREIMQESLQYKEYSVDTVFFGGGTPSILKGEEIAECMGTLRQYYQVSPDAEVTLEMNPGTADRNKLQILKKAGINRIPCCGFWEGFIPMKSSYRFIRMQENWDLITLI